MRDGVKNYSPNEIEVLKHDILFTEGEYSFLSPYVYTLR